jgi:AAA15 family ATPase/GTPase
VWVQQESANQSFVRPFRRTAEIAIAQPNALTHCVPVVESTTMLESISIKHFRGFEELTIGPLKRVNLIVGQNNTGKTAVLEALAWLLAKNSADAVQVLPNLFRVSSGDRIENFWKWLFTKKDESKPVQIEAKIKNLQPFSVLLVKAGGNINIDSANLRPSVTVGQFAFFTAGGRNSAGVSSHVFSTHPSNPRQDAIDFNRVVLHRRKKQVESLLQKIEPRLQSIESLQTGSEPLLYADIGLSEMIPVTQLGQGFNRLLDIYSELVAAEAKVLLIDEIENGLHHSVLKTVWMGLFTAAKEMNVQIFATTHSWECVLAADEAASKQPLYDLNLVRLDRVEDEINATIIDQQALGTAKELHWEMR